MNRIGISSTLVILMFSSDLFSFSLTNIGNIDNTISGNFTQRTTVPGFLDGPISEGRFFYAPDIGLVWIVEKPITEASYITENGIRKADQSYLQNQQARMGKILFGLLSLDNSAERYFHRELSGNEADWEINLRPKQRIVKKQIKLIRLKGEKFLSSLTIQFTDGKHILISFNGVTPIDKLPTAHCELLTNHECS